MSENQLVREVIGSIFERLKHPRFASKDVEQFMGGATFLTAYISTVYPIAHLTIMLKGGEFSMTLVIDHLNRKSSIKEVYEYHLSNPSSIDKIQDKIDELVNTWR